MYTRLISTLVVLGLLNVWLTWSEAATVIRGTVVAISDGDTAVVLVQTTQHRVRLYGIDAPEKSQAYGSAARQALAALIFQQPVTVVSLEKDRYGRHVGLVVLPDGRVANHLMVQQGMAWFYRQYAPHDAVLEALHGEARALGRGLWADPSPTPPWAFRKPK